MIKDKVEEILPQLIDEYMKQFSVNIYTTVNGKATDEISKVITDMIVDKLR